MSDHEPIYRQEVFEFQGFLISKLTPVIVTTEKRDAAKRPVFRYAAQYQLSNGAVLPVSGVLEVETLKQAIAEVKQVADAEVRRRLDETEQRQRRSNLVLPNIVVPKKIVEN